jgi:undecaprenyl pyrophosphate phosphatase UppP
MEVAMRNLALQAAGVLAILVAFAHGIIAELRVFSHVRIEPSATRRLLRMVWQASTVDWIAMGALLIAAPMFGSEPARQWVVAVAVVVYGYAALGNAMATRGRHVGWCLMLLVVVLALLGR